MKDNAIAIVRSGANQYQVSGLTIGTDVTSVHLKDGAAADSVTAVGVTGGVSVDLQNGNDVVLIHNAGIAGNLTVNTGNGNDTINLAGVTVGKDLTVNAGNGNDSVDISTLTLTRGNLFVNTQEADRGSGDNVRIDGITVNGIVSVASLSGNDSIVVLNPQVTGNLTVSAGDGDNKIALFANEGGSPNVTGSLTVSSRNGNDTVGLLGVTVGKDLNVTTGNGNDVIGLAQARVSGKLTIDAGNAALKGGDKIDITGTNIGGNVTIRSGGGADALGIGDVNDPVFDRTMQDLIVKLFGQGSGIQLVKGPVAVAAGNADINTGNGNDSVAIVGLTTNKGYLIVNAQGADQGGGDNVRIDDATVAGILSVTSLSGNDTVVIVNPKVTGNLTVDTGDGNDTMGVFGSFAAAVDNHVALADGYSVLGILTVKSRNGDDIAALKGLKAGGTLVISMANGNDTIGVADVQVVKNLTIDAGNGGSGQLPGDKVHITRTRVDGDVSITTGNGPDQVELGDFYGTFQTMQLLFNRFEPMIHELATIQAGSLGAGGRLTITTGNLDDEVLLQNVKAKQMTINTGSGNDHFFLRQGCTADDAVVAMDSGSDKVFVDGVISIRKLSLDGGAGRDELWPRPYPTNWTVKNFEL